MRRLNPCAHTPLLLRLSQQSTGPSKQPLCRAVSLQHQRMQLKNLYPRSKAPANALPAYSLYLSCACTPTAVRSTRPPFKQPRISQPHMLVTNQLQAGIRAYKPSPEFTPSLARCLQQQHSGQARVVAPLTPLKEAPVVAPDALMERPKLWPWKMRLIETLIVAPVTLVKGLDRCC